MTFRATILLLLSLCGCSATTPTPNIMPTATAAPRLVIHPASVITPMQSNFWCGFAWTFNRPSKTLGTFIGFIQGTRDFTNWTTLAVTNCLPFNYVVLSYLPNDFMFFRVGVKQRDQL